MQQSYNKQLPHQQRMAMHSSYPACNVFDLILKFKQRRHKMPMMKKFRGLMTNVLIYMCTVPANTVVAAAVLEIHQLHVTQASGSFAPLPNCILLNSQVDTILRVTNTGSEALSGITVNFNTTPGYASNITMVSNLCSGITLAVGASCDFTMHSIAAGDGVCRLNTVSATGASPQSFTMAILT
jgi:hypothetical protein